MMTRARFVLVTALLAAAAGGACGKKKDAGSAAGKETKVIDAAAPAPAIDAAPAAPAIDAAPAAPAADGAFVVPTDAPLVKESAARKADASALGTSVTVHLVEKVAAPTGDDSRHVDQLLVLQGTGALVVELGFATDLGAKYKDQGEEVRTVEPIDPPRPFAKDDAGAMLGFKGPIAYVKHWAGDEESGDDLAVAQDGDALVVWRSQTLDGEAGDWFEQARVKLAPGATLAWK
jgi:hypothetical protein